MNQNDPSGLVRMLDDFRSGTKLQYRRQSSTYLAQPLSIPVPLTPSDKAKRPFDETVLNENAMLIKKSKKSDSLLSDNSFNDSVDSPWEVNHLRSQLTQARAEIKSLEHRVAQLHGLRKEAEQLFENEKNSLKSTIDQDRISIQNLERRVTILKRKEEKLKEDVAILVEQMNTDRNDKEDKNIALYDENTVLKHKFSQLEEEFREKAQLVKSLEVDKKRLENEVGICNDKITAVTNELVKLRQTVSDFETTKAALENAQLTIRELENARKSYEEMDAMVKSQQNKLMRYSELERNLNHYVYQNSKLMESCSNNIHLESLVEELRQRLVTLEDREKEVLKLRVDLGVAESNLNEYKALTLEAIGEGAGPVQLGAYVRQLQNKSLLASSQQSQLTNKIKNLEESEKLTLAEVAKLKQEVEKLKDELNVTSNNLRRLKKQNALIVWERNDLRSLIDSCQKEVTISGHHLPASESRLELLEKLVDGYRERIKQMEADPSIITHAPANSMSSMTTDQSAELDKLKTENKALKDKIEKLEYEMEHRSLKGDFNTLNTKILHFKMNPTTEALNSREDELEKLRKELFEKNERLKLYMEGNVNDVTQEIAQRQDLAKEVTELKDKVKSQETVIQRLKEAFKTKGHEFREAVNTLLGYKVDGLPNSLYRLCSAYAEAPDQYLMFKMTSKGMELLETEYSRVLTELVEDVLVRHESIPVFLSTLTMDLFKKQSHSMMTTMTTTSTS